ncbi:hypothetical protein [Deinococcus ficus]|uniref:hypothetical protein n=2 Tax=Deinococcus ficus TaxID=317577 RepID=UPI0012DF86C3|nr:hypothetical protein [Deinococcus ficus]
MTNLPSKDGMTRNRIIAAAKFILVLSIINLHTLRNVSTVLYMSIYVPVVLMVLVDCLIKRSPRFNAFGLLLMIFWILAMIYGFFISVQFISLQGGIYGLVRILFAFPILLALYAYTNNINDVKHFSGYAVIFFAIASLSLPLQFLTGPIPWFPAEAERAGFVRFSSLIGSLTSIGVIVGSYMTLSQKTVKYQYIWLSIIVVCAVISLSKAAIANIGIALTILILLNIKSISKTIITLILVCGSFIALYSSVDQISNRVNAVLTSFGVSVGNERIINYDYSFRESAFDRLTKLPLDNYNKLSGLGTNAVYLTGAGFGMASTALVPEADSLAIMAHNQYAESITVFGWLIGVLINILIISFAFIILRKYLRTKERFYLTLFAAYSIFLINSIFANGTIYQPSSATIFYIAMFVACSTDGRSYKNLHYSNKYR